MGTQGTRWRFSKKRLAEVDEALAEVEDAMLGLKRSTRRYRTLAERHHRLTVEAGRIELALWRRRGAARRKEGKHGFAGLDPDDSYDPRG